MSENIRLICCKDDLSFTLEDRLFIFQFPLLYPICSLYDISREEVYDIGNTASVFYNREEFEIGLKMYIINLIEYGKPYMKKTSNSKAYNFYCNLKLAGVGLYKDEDGNIKIGMEE